MEKVRFPRNYRLYLPLAVLFVILTFLMPRSGKFGYDYRKGAPWMHETLVAQFDFPILKTDEQLEQERESLGTESIPYYRYSSAVADEVKAAVSVIDFGEYDTIRPAVMDEIDVLYNAGILPDFTGSDANDKDKVLLVQKDKRAEKIAAAEFFTEKEAEAWFADVATKACPGLDADSLFKVTNFYSAVRPNLIYDKEATDLVHQKSVDYISRTSGVAETGTVIVKEGEIVTAEVKQMLDSYKAEYDKSIGYDGPKALLWLGNAGMSLLLVVLLFLSLLYGNASVFDSMNRYLYILVLFIISILMTYLVDRFAPKYMYVIPYSLITLYLMAFFKKRVVMPAYIMTLIPLLLIAHNGVELFVINLAAGMIGIFTFSYLNHGWHQFLNAVCIFISAVVVWTVFRLMEGNILVADWKVPVQLFLGSMLCVAAYPLIYLFEKMFNLVSNSRLQDLCDTNTKLLRELASKAPGTFQHSLQVMNLADAAARSIDANVLLTRAGALYHDIGKMENPQCFIENQTAGVDYHKGLTPAESAHDIIKHVSDGMALADKYKLPGEISQFILTHHGTSATGYFLTKYLNDGGDPDNTAAFYYNGVIPTTKEQSIVMVCDTLEAASRTLTDFSKEAVSQFVEGVFASKVKAGQFSDSELTQHEIGVVKQTLVEYMCSMHHARIVYPKRKEKKLK